MGQKVTTSVVDRSQQDQSRWILYIFLLKMLGKDIGHYQPKLPST